MLEDTVMMEPSSGSVSVNGAAPGLVSAQHALGVAFQNSKIGVRNITDEEARVHTSYLKEFIPLPGRNFRLGLSTRF